MIESGHVFYANDICSDPDPFQDSLRGDTVAAIMLYIGADYEGFEKKYFPAGAQSFLLPLEENYSFTYTGDKKFKFSFALDRGNEFLYFDLHEVK